MPRARKEKIVTDAELGRMYRRFNIAYFGNELPKKLPCRFKDLKNQGYGLTEISIWRHVRGASPQLPPPRAKYLWLDNKLKKNRSAAYMTLLHEMVHVENPGTKPKDEHGRWFHDRMCLLAVMGAFEGYW